MVRLNLFTVGELQKSTGGSLAMQKLAEYLDYARQFERLAAEETSQILKAQFEKQAIAYRSLAEQRERFLRATNHKAAD
jgi:hypothetical protein